MGKGIRLATGEGRWLTIVGVVADARQRAVIDRSIRPEIYVCLRQAASRDLARLIRSQIDPESLTGVARQVVRGLDPELPIYDVLLLAEIVARAFGPKRLSLLLLALFGGIGLALASAGLYAILACSVAERRHELGIRMALGPSSKEVIRLVLGEGLRLASVGLAVGILGAVAASRVAESLLGSLSAPYLACILSSHSSWPQYPRRPASFRRSAGPRVNRVDPLLALRSE